MKLPTGLSIGITTALLCTFSAASIIIQDVSMLFVAVTGLLLYASLIYIAKSTGSISALYLSIMLIVSRAATLPMVYYLRDDFTKSGWTAIKQFNFSSYEYFQLIIKDSFAFLLIIIAVMLIRMILPRSPYRLQRAARAVLCLSIFPKAPKGYNVIPLLLMFLVVNYMIFRFANANNIGITGIEPNQLPFRLAGIIYYYLKFVGPILLFYFIRNSKAKLLVLLLSPLLIFVGVSTLSRSTVAMWAIPITFVAYRNCRSISFSVLVAIMVTIASIFAEAGRSLMFVANGTSIGIDITVGMSEVAERAIERISFSDILIAIASLVARLGGGQELILGSQTVFPDFDYSMNLLLQIFTGLSFGIDYDSLVMLTHGFLPLKGTVAGIAYSGYMLAFMNSGYAAYMLFVLFSASVLSLNDVLRSKIWKLTQNRKAADWMCFALNFLFFALFMVSWYWVSVLLILIFTTAKLSGDSKYALCHAKDGGN